MKTLRDRLFGRPATPRGYAICTQPRSGSNLFCQYLSSTDRLGHPLEYFNASGRRALGIADFPDDPARQIAFLLREARSSNGVYALKLFAHQHDPVAARLRWTSALPNLKFVYHTRHDLLGQAISWARATQTQQYRSTQTAQRAPVYDGKLILDRLLAIVRERARWEAFFARCGIAPLRTVYEDVAADPLREVRRVAELLQLDEKASPLCIDATKVDLAIQRDAETEVWRQRFHDEFADADHIDAI
jgi:LPS sulfotransferase NodH